MIDGDGGGIKGAAIICGRSMTIFRALIVGVKCSFGAHGSSTDFGSVEIGDVAVIVIDGELQLGDGGELRCGEGEGGSHVDRPLAVLHGA